jgi:vacuolar-type H+-ATPase subunit E/Vma4
MAESPKFSESRRGYEPVDVDRAFAEITTRVARAQSEREEADQVIERLTRELNEAKSAIKRANSKPSFSDLGAAFEQTLRVAEEQAGKLLKDAQDEVHELRTNASAEAERITASAVRQAEKLAEEAEKRAGDLAEQSQRRSIEIVQIAESRLEAARVGLDAAREQALKIEQDADQTAVEILAQVQKETDDARAEMSTLRQLNEREQQRVQREIEALQEKTDREARRLSEQTSSYIAEITRDAETQVTEADAHAAGLLEESEALFARAHADGDALVEKSKATAAELVERAQERASALNTRMRIHAQDLYQENVQRLAELEEQRQNVNSFAAELEVALGSIAVDDDFGSDSLADDVEEI